MSDRVITSLAILKVNWDAQQHDYIENFVPFIAECLRNSSQPVLTISEIQTCAEQQFGLRIPQAALRTILNRVTRLGYLKQSHNTYRKTDRAAGASDFPKVRSIALRQHEALLARLRAFCQNHYQISWSDQEAESALLTYIQERATPILEAAVNGSPIQPSATRDVAHAEFLVNAFILSLFETDPEGFGFLETIVKGSMLANALIFPSIGEAKRHFDHVEFYLDTPFITRALGLHGSAIREACLELLNLLYTNNGELRCFEHSLEEVRGILKNASRTLLNPRSVAGPENGISDLLALEGYQSSDIELLLTRLDRTLDAMHVRGQGQTAPREPAVNR